MYHKLCSRILSTLEFVRLLRKYCAGLNKVACRLNFLDMARWNKVATCNLLWSLSRRKAKYELSGYICALDAHRQASTRLEWGNNMGTVIPYRKANSSKNILNGSSNNYLYYAVSQEKNNRNFQKLPSRVSVLIWFIVQEIHIKRK